ncbi:ATP-binding cassette domain-containing protein [Winogradskyella alexanderae]|uniref:ABC transporter ATP-binding protein n=1 Tax=Winogradskyella alexanderae TaxID=2877123 RepID=A0ABS7XUP7_9FLAO|nr:ABC transporter ATP-binding protein [Winogradskyella alexanderae]MCA0133735.1 ABC transporter ATP-binding protein [Winogradskyella alexanderae]
MKFELDNVELYFKNKSILSGIYLKAETGKVTAILGTNGSGKSCLLRIAFGNLKPKYKLVRINGKPLLKPLYKTKNIKFLPQYNFVPSGMTLNFVFKTYGLNWETFIKEFDEFLGFKTFNFSKLSGGQRRIVETYIILKAKSEIVLLDEPFSHISPLYVEKIKTLINDEKSNKIIIITDHMYRHIIEVSDTIYLLKNGATKRINKLTELEDYKYLSQGSLN